MNTMHDVPPLLNDPDADQFREMCWLCSRAVYQDCLARDNPVTLGCWNDDYPLFPPGRLA